MAGIHNHRRKAPQHAFGSLLVEVAFSHLEGDSSELTGLIQGLVNLSTSALALSLVLAEPQTTRSISVWLALASVVGVSVIPSPLWMNDET